MRFDFVICSLSVVLATGLISCSESLSDEELDVINDNLARITYTRNIEQRAESVSEYLSDAVEVYADQVHNQTQSKIDDRNATAALMGGNPFDIGELFGTSGNEMLAKRYYRYVDYVNDHLEDVEDDIETITGIIKSSPTIIDSFYDGRSTISLSEFAKVEGMPSTLSSSQFERYKNIEFDKSSRATWGELLMGTVSAPQYNPATLLCALVIRIERLKYPKPVYAVYKEYDEEEGWEVGYDTSQAYFVTFEEDGDILQYDYTPVDYFEGYIKSENNKLTTKK